MKELADGLELVVNALNTLVSSPPAVILLVVMLMFGFLLWKVVRYVTVYTLRHSAKLGHVEAIAVGYKVLHEGVDPAHALREIRRELDEL